MTGFAHITNQLKEARETIGLSQKELGTRVGIPQSQISRIESSVVDLRLSSLIALARGLDLELTLVPRGVVPAVQSIVRRRVHHNDEVRPAYSLDDEDDDG